ncbi:hypothetical protein MKX03_032892 [Papaver bracteatum]|nr:hypothetical protein MKX03_032892 [Papaver bracteatum]
MAGGTDDHGAVLGDWAISNPSPRTFFSSIMGGGDDFSSKSFLDVFDEKLTQGTAAVIKHKIGMNLEQEVGKEIGNSGDLFSANMFSVQKSGPRGGGLAERMAARAGFNAPRLNTAKISSSEAQSPYLTIPPGLSPTTLLDSPVFLSNSLAQPSPTTGKFSFALNNSNNFKDNPFEDFDSLSFVFKPHADPNSLYFPGGGTELPPASNPHESYTKNSVPAQSEQSLLTRNLQADKFQFGNRTNLHQTFSQSFEKESSGNNIYSEPNETSGNLNNSPPPNDLQDGGEGERGNGDISTTTVGTGASSDDGYNWRKYGQKQVKGSEFPRSYFKCTHPNCQVKKKVERSQEGHITEIIYKGAHNHPKPSPHRRSGLGSSNPPSDTQHDLPENGAPDCDSVWASSQRGCSIVGSDIKNDNLEIGSSPALSPEFCNPSTLIQAKDGSCFENADSLNISAVSNDEEEDDRGTHGSASLGYEGEGDESESKRRKIDACAMDMSGATRSIREPRVVVQTTSEVDILDDGYRWRKYGQKVVKGNPNPRSYYKCTNAGCTVRKHVERASHDLKSVITTYEGKHNHDVPAARNSSHVNSGLTNTGQTHIHRPEPTQIHENIGRFSGPASLNAFNLPGRQQLGPQSGYSFGINHPQGMQNHSMTSLVPGQGKLTGIGMHSYLEQQRQASGLGFMMPKGEPKEELVSEPSLNHPNGASLYQEIMNRLPR